MTERRKRLIEVAFPLEEVSRHSRREKNITYSHISTLHLWWARRPLAACRAFIYAASVDDPENDLDREALLKEVADLASWDAVRHPEKVVRSKEEGGSGLTGRVLLERARERVLESNDGQAPKLVDPFAGGGAIPLEALRLGLDAEASDLNPVAVMILKATIEYPQKYGRPDSQPAPSYVKAGSDSEGLPGIAAPDLLDAYRANPLVTDVRYWGNWMLARASEELATFYPSDVDGEVPVAYLWSRTVPCPNCKNEMFLIRQYWLSNKKNQRTALRPRVYGTRVEFDVYDVEPGDPDPAKATTTRGDTECLICHQVAKNAEIKRLANEGKMGARLLAVVTARPGLRSRQFRAAQPSDLDSLKGAQETLQTRLADWDQDYSLIPNEPLSFHPQYMLVREWGLDEWGKLFNPRQLLAVATFSKLVREAHAQMLVEGRDPSYAVAVATYLGLFVDKIALRASTCGVWHAGRLTIENIMGDGTLPMAWDYPEAVLTGDASGGASTSLRYLVAALERVSEIPQAGSVFQRDARVPAPGQGLCITDPPYYDAINYADLSDFFHVWLRRSIGALHPDILGLPLTPKAEQIVMNVYRQEGEGAGRKAAARADYEGGMAQAFAAVGASVEDRGVIGVVFAHTDPDAWASLIEGMLSASIVPVSSWPIDTERQTGSTKQGKAKLRTSVWMACKARSGAADDAFLGELLEEMRIVIRERLLHFWSQGIRGADFFISAIGPALSVFGRHNKVLRPDGSDVSVRDFLDIVRRESTTVALEQVLQGADLGQIDPVTRQYVTWAWSYGKAPLDTGEAIALGLATGADYHDAVRDHGIAVEKNQKSKKVVALRTIQERGEEDEHLGEGTSARPAPLIDQMQHAAWLWSQNRAADLGQYRGTLGESRWGALRTLAQAVAECLPESDEDRRLINGLLASNAMASQAPESAAQEPEPQGILSLGEE